MISPSPSSRDAVRRRRRGTWGRAVWLLARDAAASLLGRPGHTIGMVSGIMLGVASALAAVVIADTQQAQINARFDLQRSDHAIVKANNPTRAGFPADQVAKVAALGPVSAIGEFSIWSDSERVSRSTASTHVTAPLLVADPGGLRATGTTVAAGASSGLLRLPRPTPIAWIGVDLARDLGVAVAEEGQATDSQVLVRGVPLSVAGILTNDEGFGYLSHSVVVSRRVAVDSFGGGADNVRLVAHVRPGSAGAVSAYTIRAADPSGDLILQDETPPDGQKLVKDVGSDLRRIGAALGGFIGLVGMIAVANTLMMSVHQRRRELGLRSAMGWSRGRIGLLVLTESGVAGFVAGILGSAFGLAAAAIWCWLHGWTLIMPTLLPALVIAGGIAASLLGGLVPAYRAASTSPLTAMRS